MDKLNQCHLGKNLCIKINIIKFICRSEQPCSLKPTIILPDDLAETVSSLLMLLQTGSVTVLNNTEKMRVQQLQRRLGCGFSMQAPITNHSFKLKTKEKWLISKTLLTQNDIEDDIGHSHASINEKENTTEPHEKIYCCQYCEMKFSKTRGLSDHIRNVHGSKKYCDLCPQEFSSSQNLFRHKKQVHIQWEGIIQCDKCGKKFKRRENLMCHMTNCPKPQVEKKKVYKREKYECQYCSSILTGKYSLNRHVASKHTIQKNKQFYMVVANTLSKYKKIKEDFLCKTCPRIKQFSSKFNLKRHIQSKHAGRNDIVKYGGGYMKLSTEQQNENITRSQDCMKCKLSFSSINELQYHNDIQHPNEKYQCKLCPKSFAKKKGLKSHKMRLHREIKYQCTICLKQFPRKYEFIRHCKTHTNTKKIKPLEHVSRSMLLKRMKKQAGSINSQIDATPAVGKTILWKELVKYNPSLLDKKEDPLTEEEVIEMIQDANLSDNTMVKILRKLRKKWGMKAITPHIRRQLIKRKTITNKFFTCRLLIGSGPKKTDMFFKTKNGDPLTRYVVFCHDIPGLIAWKRLLENKNDTEYINVIGVDDGKGILKICWNWSIKENDEGKIKLMGPKKSILLACVAMTPETSHNIKILYDIANLNEVDFLLSQDLKLHNITLGKQTHSSKHPCPYCTGYYNSKSRRWVKGESITLKKLNSDRNRWLEETGGIRKKLQDFNNVEHPAIVSFDENTKVLLKIPPPSLHVCLLGPTNDIIHHLEKIYPDVTKILDIDLHLVREDYQGKTYEGKFSSRVCFQNIYNFWYYKCKANNDKLYVKK